MSAGCKIFYIFRCTVGSKAVEQPNQIVTETPIWEILRNDIEQKVLRRAALGNNGGRASSAQQQQQQQRGREACGQKLIGKVIANLSSADEALTRVGSSQDCHERATHLPWLSNNTLLENGDIVLLYRVPIDYEHHAKTESLLCDASHMRWLFLNKAQGNRLPAKAYKNSIASAIESSATIPANLLPLVRQTVSNNLSSKRSAAPLSAPDTKECGHSKLFITSSNLEETNANEAAEKLVGTTEAQRIEALLRKNTAFESDEPQRKRTKLLSDEPEATFDSESFWSGDANNARRSSTPPALYVCNRCGVPGHWLRDCPTKNDARFNGVKILTTNGIPKHYLKRVNVQDFDFDTTVTLYRNQEGHFFVKK